MQARHPLIHGILYAGLLVSASSSAQFRADPNLKGSGLDGNYGTYAPRGDCTREPRITVDDSGFTFRYGQHATHPPAVATDGSYFGRQDTLLAFFPFPTGVKRGESGLEAANPGPLLMALDTHAFTLAVSASNPGVPLTPLQQALIKHSPYARCGAQGVASHATGLSAAAAANAGALKINVSQPADQIKPTAAQTAAIRRAAAADIKEFNHPEQGGYVVAQADLNDDGRPDLLVQYDDMAFCGSHGCSGVIVMATAHGYSSHAIGLPNFYGEIDVLPGKHDGMHDLQFDGDSPIWQWTGSQYDIPKADQPQTHAPAWETRAAAGRTLALVVPIDSVIKSLSVFCDGGKPVLAMLLKTPRASQATTLTWVFNGWTVNVPMSPANRDATLWMAYLSKSQVPQWLAHRGTDATTRKIAPFVTDAYLRINGEMQGQVSMQDSTDATRAALARCYRY